MRCTYPGTNLHCGFGVCGVDQQSASAYAQRRGVQRGSTQRTTMRRIQTLPALGCDTTAWAVLTHCCLHSRNPRLAISYLDMTIQEKFQPRPWRDLNPDHGEYAGCRQELQTQPHQRGNQ